MTKLCLTISIALSTATAAVLQGHTSSVPNARRVTVTGCIEPASAQTPIGTTGRIGRTVDTKFVLTTPWAGNATDASGAPATAKNTVYRLEDAEHASVSAHEGQKVEITGTMSQARSQPGESANATKAVRRVPMLAVEAVKTISSTCSR